MDQKRKSFFIFAENREAPVVFILFGALMVASVFLDLPLSGAVFSPKNAFGVFFQNFGELAGVLVCVFSCAALLATRGRDNRRQNIGGAIAYGVLLALASVMAAAMPLRYTTIPMFPLALLLAAVFAALALLAAHRLAKQHPRELRIAGAVGIFLMLAMLVLINLVKLLWGRERYYVMGDPTAEFTMWFIPQGIAVSDEFMSFPSGHSAHSAIILWITMLPTFWDAAKGKEVLLKIIAYGYTLLVMASRIVMGKHFLSDVTMGAFLSILAFYIIKHLVALHFEKKDAPAPAVLSLEN